MGSTVIDRRVFCRRLLSLAALPVLGVSPAAEPSAVTLLSTAKIGEQYFLMGLEATGQVRYQIRLPARAHDVVLHPSAQWGVVVARRPGRYLLLFERVSGRVLQQTTLPDSQHLYGHGVFSADGEWFYTPESEIESGQGWLQVWRCGAGQLQRAHHWPLEGIGPHELVLMPDQAHVAVALGGILTHPSSGRQPLNLHSMRSELLLLRLRDGEVVMRLPTPETRQRLSLRHLDVTPQGDILVAGQFQGSMTEVGGLLALWRPGQGDWQWLQPPKRVHRRLRNYCGSVRVNGLGDWFAVSAPKGHTVTFWRAQSGEYGGSVPLRDGCGLASVPGRGHFMLTSGTGQILEVEPESLKSNIWRDSAQLSLNWDNHARAVI